MGAAAKVPVQRLDANMAAAERAPHAINIAADELEELQALRSVMQRFHPTSSLSVSDAAAAQAHRLYARRGYANTHAWIDNDVSEEGAPSITAATVAPSLRPSNNEDSQDRRHASGGRIPREHDAASLLQALSIKDALLRQMEAVLLLQPPDRAVTIGLGRRAQALVANSRQRETVLSLKLRALSKEIEGFRQRERESVALNAGLQRRLCTALADNDAVRLRREVREVRSDLSAALARESALQGALLQAHLREAARNSTLEHLQQRQASMADDMDYVRQVAVHAMSERAGYALGDDREARWRSSNGVGNMWRTAPI